MAKKLGRKSVSGKDSPRKRAPSIRAFDEETLWKKVLRQCEAEFEETFGRPWSPDFPRLGERDHELEKEARDIYSRLRSALDEAIAFARRPDVVGHGWPEEATRVLRDWVPTHVEPLRRQSWLSPRDGRKALWSPILDPRANIVHVLDRYNLFGVKRPDGSDRFMTVREMVIVSLLAGNRPKLSGGALNFTVAEVIKRESNNIRPLVKKHGARSVTDEERGGPAVRAPPPKPVMLTFSLGFATDPPEARNGSDFTPEPTDPPRDGSG